jgi:hypothetical protein
MRFHGGSPFGHAALDVKTFAMAMLECDYSDCARSSLPPAWSDPLPHNHVALDDAREQGALFCNMLRVHGVAGK